MRYECIVLPTELPRHTIYLVIYGAETRDRTGDLILTMDVLYQLSYLGLFY